MAHRGQQALPLRRTLAGIDPRSHNRGNSDPDKRLLLTARGWPVSEANAQLLLTAEGNGTRVEIRETTTGGAGRLLRNPVGEKLVYRRNVESMARLAALAERRTKPVVESEGSEEI